MSFDSPVTDLKGVGEALAKKFALLGIHKLEDLINYYPRKYQDYSIITTVNRLAPGPVSLEVKIKTVKGRYARRGLHITEAIGSDKTGSVRLIWFNQPYRANSIKSDEIYLLSGNYELSRSRFSIINPALELKTDFPANTARILSIYRETKGLDSRQIRLAIKQVDNLIEALPESLPQAILKDFDLMNRSSAMKELHFPSNMEGLEKARRRIGFEEVFTLSLASLLNKQENQKQKAIPISFNETLAKDFSRHLPFKLTDGQRLTTWKILQDITKSQPMNRLIEGDVGSGKTVVASMAAIMALKQHYQVVLMAPTEILARQHASTVYNLLKPLGLEKQVVLLVGSMTKLQKNKAKEAIKHGKAGFIIGTHALIQEDVDMHSLALVIIDEQHRFGVEQRKSLIAKAGHMPHLLSLTATPIPRSLALTLYGELDISLLKDKPKGRQDITTEIIWPGEKADLLKKLDEELAQGRQMFVVCPNISDSSISEAKAAEVVYEELAKGPFRHRKIGLMHGKLNAKDKQEVMEKFVAGTLDILVSTTVIEVGVDVPNATIMLVYSPDRFGLAQLHQLRGRVGRGQHKGYCYLLLDSSDQPTRRLRALASSSDGFRLAELDLELRGPGAIYGTSQHGTLDLRIARLTDSQLIKDGLNAAKWFIETKQPLVKYKELNQHIKKLRVVTNLN